MTENTHNIDLARARHVMRCCQDDGIDIKALKKLAEDLPPRIRRQGLAQTAADLLRLNDQGEIKDELAAKIAEWLCDWLKTASPMQGLYGFRQEGDLTEQLLQRSNDHTYYVMQEDALAWLVWLKKVARSLAQVDSQQTTPTEAENG